MKKIVWAFILGTATAQAAYAFGRDKVESLWPEKPVVIDGRATEWTLMPVLEDEGLGFRAMNDASNLYILIRGTANNGRVQLSGRYRQNVTLWFLKADHKTKDWGIMLDFTGAKPLSSVQDWQSLDTIPLSAFGITPEMILPQGLEISTAALPADIEFQADLSSQHSRQPVYEMCIPLQRLQRNGKSIYVDFVTTEVSPEVRAEVQSIATETHGGGNGSVGNQGAGGSPGGHGGRHRGGGMGGQNGGQGTSSVELPKPLDLHLTIRLAKDIKS